MAIAWTTTKTEAGYLWHVYEFGYQTKRLLKSGRCGTRAQATGAAKRWTLHFKALQRIAAAAA